MDKIVADISSVIKCNIDKVLKDKRCVWLDITRGTFALGFIEGGGCLSIFFNAVISLIYSIIFAYLLKGALLSKILFGK